MTSTMKNLNAKLMRSSVQVMLCHSIRYTKQKYEVMTIAPIVLVGQQDKGSIL
jgi:hypothetical protein